MTTSEKIKNGTIIYADLQDQDLKDLFENVAILTDDFTDFSDPDGQTLFNTLVEEVEREMLVVSGQSSVYFFDEGGNKTFEAFVYGKEIAEHLEIDNEEFDLLVFNVKIESDKIKVSRKPLNNPSFPIDLIEKAVQKIQNDYFYNGKAAKQFVGENKKRYKLVYFEGGAKYALPAIEEPKLSQSDIDRLTKAISDIQDAKLKNAKPTVAEIAPFEDLTIDQLKARQDFLLKQANDLSRNFKKIYANADIESPMGKEEREMKTQIANLFSQVNDITVQIRKAKQTLTPNTQPPIPE